MSKLPNINDLQHMDLHSVFGLVKSLLSDSKTTTGHEQVEEIVRHIISIRYKQKESRKSVDSIDESLQNSTSSILKGLQTLEFAVQQNIHGDAMVRYKGIPISRTETLEELFSFKCSIVENKYSVTSISWHKVNSDILAVGYTCNDLKEESPRGMILIWTMRNPSYPEKIFQTDDGVCSLAFSNDRVSILAVGCDSGCIYLYDITLSEYLVIDNSSAPGRHMSSVTHLQWISDTERGASEILISIGIDGKVIQWSIKKGLHPQPLITLKRHNAESKYHRLPDVAMGLSLDFLRGNDFLTYICGAEDGTIFRCSRSYAEQYLHHTMAHNGPVTQIVASPHEDELFISSGADSTIKLWVAPTKQNSMKLILSVSPTNLLAPINDVVWSPVSPTVFCFVTGDGRFEVWDLLFSISAPLHTKSSMSPIMKGNEFTKVSFTANGRTIIIGCDNGTVLTYSLPTNCSECKNDIHLVDIIKSWQ